MDLESFNTSRESLVPLLALNNKSNKNIIIFPTDKEAIEFATNFSNLRNKEENEGFIESVNSKSGDKKRFFNLGFNNRWEKIFKFNKSEVIAFYKKMT